MKVKVEKAGPCRKNLIVELPVDRVTAEYQRVLGQYVKAGRIPGFRAGHAPPALVERHFAKDLAEDVKERLVGQTYAEALKQEALAPLAIIDLQVTYQKGRPLTYQVTLDVPPEFKLPRYKGLALKENPVAVTETAVQKRLDELLDRLAKFDPVENRPVRKGDVVQLDYTGVCDGRPLEALGRETAGLGHGKDAWVMADENAFLPGFDTGLIGLAVDDQKDLAVAFPGDYRIKAVAGKTVQYHVTVKAIREKKLPPLDAAILKELEADSEAALRTRIREALLAEAGFQEKERLKHEIVQFLLAKIALELPASVLQDETRHMFASLVRQNLMRGMPREQVEGQRDQFMSAATKSAGDKVKVGYILHRIAEEEKITVTEDAVNQAVAALARRYQMPPDDLRKMLEEKRELDAIRHELRMNQTLDFILENAKSTEEGFFSRLLGKDKKHEPS